MAQRPLTAEDVQRQIEELNAQNAALSALAAAGGGSTALAWQQAAVGAHPGALLGLHSPALGSLATTAFESFSAAAAPPTLQTVKAKREAEKKEREQKRKLRRLAETSVPNDGLKSKPTEESGPQAQLKRIDTALAEGQAVRWFREAYSAQAEACSTDMIGDVALAKLQEARQSAIEGINATQVTKLEVPVLPSTALVEEEPKKKSFLILKKTVIGAPKRKAAVRSAVRPVQAAAPASVSVPANTLASAGLDMYDPESVTDDDDVPPPPPPPPPGGPPPPMEAPGPTSAGQLMQPPHIPNGGGMMPFSQGMRPISQFEQHWGSHVGPLPGLAFSCGPPANNGPQPPQSLPQPFHSLPPPLDGPPPFQGQPAAGLGPSSHSLGGTHQMGPMRTQVPNLMNPSGQPVAGLGPSSHSLGGAHQMGPMRTQVPNLMNPGGPGLLRPPPPPPMHNANSDPQGGPTGPPPTSSTPTSEGFWRPPPMHALPAPPQGMPFRPVLDTPQPPNGFQGHAPHAGGQPGPFLAPHPPPGPLRPPQGNGILSSHQGMVPGPGFNANTPGPPGPGPMVRLRPPPPPGGPRPTHSPEPGGPPAPLRPMTSVFQRPGTFGAMQPISSSAMPVLHMGFAASPMQPNGLGGQSQPPRPPPMLAGLPPRMMMDQPPRAPMFPGIMRPPQ